jgi:methylmalonyl-CoA mutase N-terminal domain/subunit
LGGSFYVEALTNDIEKRILDEVDEIERMGGIVDVVTSGWLHSKVIRHIEREQKMIDNGDIKVVGRNYFRTPDLKLPDVRVHEYDENIARQMRDKLARIRQHRDNEKASSCLNALKEACKRGDNIMQYTLECARADVTEGEMRRALTEVFGQWKPPIYR